MSNDEHQLSCVLQPLLKWPAISNSRPHHPGCTVDQVTNWLATSLVKSEGFVKSVLKKAGLWLFFGGVTQKIGERLKPCQTVGWGKQLLFKKGCYVANL